MALTEQQARRVCEALGVDPDECAVQLVGRGAFKVWVSVGETAWRIAQRAAAEEESR